MALSFTQLLAGLKNKEYAPVYFFHGDESYYIDQLLSYIENNVLDESEKAFNQTVLYGKESEFKQVVDSARQFPMMSERRVVLIKEAQEMKTLKQLESYVSNPSPQTILAIAFKHKKLDKRTKFAKAISKHGVLFESKKLYDNQLPQWINTRVGELGYKIDAKANHLLCEYLGTDLNKVNNEIKKLTINLEKGSSIDEQLIQDQIGISKDYNVFELQKAIGTRNSKKIAMIFQYFAENQKANPLPLVISSLYGFLTKLLITKSIPNASDNMIQSALGLRSSFFSRDYKTAAANYNINTVKFMLQKLRLADLQSKGIGHRNMKPPQVYKEMAAIFVNL